MRNLILIIIFSCFFFTAQAQDISVEKCTFGIEIGTIGVWVYNEVKLTNSLALRSEFGLSGSFGKNYFYLAPGFTLEPRWYYNLVKRSEKGKDISSNSGNFISLNTSYAPDWFVISTTDNTNVNNQIAIIPTWGIRRNIGAYFNFEVGAGLGYRLVFNETEYSDNESDAAFNLLLRIGYKF